MSDNWGSIADWFNAVAAIAAAVAAWLSFKSAKQAARSADAASRQALNVELGRAAHACIADALYIQGAASEMLTAYKSTFALRGAFAGSAHQEVEAQVNGKLAKSGETERAARDWYDRMRANGLPADELPGALADCIGLQLQTRRLREELDRELSQARSELEAARLR